MSFDPTLDESALFRLCFVCTGNICRSPMAEVVFRSIIERERYANRISVRSAGTGDWHVGERSDDRTVTALAARGYDGNGHRARQFQPEWFDSLDLIVVFDRGQERMIRTWATSDADRGKVALLLGFDSPDTSDHDVPDPYYSNSAMFDRVLEMIEHACVALFDQIRPGLPAVVR